VDIKEIRKLIREKKYSISKHAFIEAFKNNFSVKDILKAISVGEIVEKYKDRNRLLIYAKLDKKLIHVVVAHSVNYIWFVTVYKPNPNE